MKKVFIDTSVFIRLFTKDDEPKSNEAIKLLKAIDAGQLRPYISNIVILEIQFVLIKSYGFAKEKVLKAVDDLLNLRNLTIIERSDSKQAIALYKKYNIKYPDCIICTQIPKGAKIVTYDEDFSKIPGVSTAKPVEY